MEPLELPKETLWDRSTAHGITTTTTTTIIIIIIIIIFRKYVSSIPGNHEVRELQKTAILGTAHTLPKVLT
jgi:hypothetical protein